MSALAAAGERVAAGATAGLEGRSRRTVAGTTRSRRVRVKPSARQGASGPVVTAVVVIAGTGFLKAWLVDKQNFPSRKYFVNLGIMGFVLALMSEVSPKLGKNTAYLVMTATIFAQAAGVDGKPGLLDALGVANPTPVKPDGSPLDPGTVVPGQSKKLGALPASSVGVFSRTAAPAVVVPRVTATGVNIRDWPRPHKYLDPQGPRAAIYGKA